MQTETTNLKINDFGQKIGGAKKDLAGQTLASISLITDDALATQPLSKLFPCPDFLKMFREDLIGKEQAQKLKYAYSLIEPRPRKSYRIKSWVLSTRKIIHIIEKGLQYEGTLDGNPMFEGAGFRNFREEMEVANWPGEDYNTYPYKICHYYGDIAVLKGNAIKKKGSLQECVQWIKDNAGVKKTKAEMKFIIYRINAKKTYIITPKGKSGIVLKEFAELDDARIFLKNDSKELERIYLELRNIPEERNNWNRPRQGKDYRKGKDITPEVFSSAFPFRGVEFGNWVNQMERSACLNDAYDALFDLASVLGVTTDSICLNGSLALAFGARGSGKASAHYEIVKKVINLTKTKGAGSLAHEWFHALDNYICTANEEPLLYATENFVKLSNSELSSALRRLKVSILQSDYFVRSERIDKYKSKKYWATTVELSARAFETYVIFKLMEDNRTNDYLANVITYGVYSKLDVYPYPTDEEMKVFTPLYDALVAAFFGVKTTILNAA